MGKENKKEMNQTILRQMRRECLLLKHTDIFRKLKNLDGLRQVKKAPGNLFTFAFRI